MLALLPLAAASAASAPAGGGFSAPSGPLVLTRTLYRPLPGGAEIVSTRSYEIRIVPGGGGFRVEGVLLSSEVSALPSLAALAAPGVRSQTSRFEWGDGKTGSVTTAIEARRDASGNSIERTVVTDTGVARRGIHEPYKISPRQS